jgi:hypothetical protein
VAMAIDITLGGQQCRDQRTTFEEK